MGGLGLGDVESRGNEPGEMGDKLPAVELGAGKKATAVSAGATHTCALLDDGSVKCWGSTISGQLGLDDPSKQPSGRAGDEPNEMGDNLPAVNLGSGRTAVAISAGGSVFPNSGTCALLDNGSLKCWGRNDWGQLGLEDTNARGDDPGEMGDNLPTVKLFSATW